MAKKKKIILLTTLVAVVMTTVIGVLVFLLNPRDKEQIYKILVIHSYKEGYSWGEEINKGISTGFSKNHLNVSLKHFYLNCEQLNAKSELAILYKLLEEQKENKPDLILVEDDQATFSLITCEHPFTKNIPIIFAGVSYLNYDILIGHNNITGFECKKELQKCIDLARSISSVKYINVVIDSTILGKASQKEIIEQWKQLPASYKTDYKLRFISPRDTRTFNVLFQFRYAQNDEIFILPRWDFTTSLFSNISNRPFYSLCNEGIGKNMNGGILGGIFPTSFQQGYDGACLAADILLKKKVITHVPLQYHASKPVYDWLQIKRLDLSPSSFPPESYFYNMPAFEKYKTVIIIISVIVAILLLTACYMLIREYIKKKRIQEQLFSNQQLLYQVFHAINFYPWLYDPNNEIFSFDKRFFSGTDIPFIKSPQIGKEEILQRIHPDDRENINAQIRNSIKHPEKRGECEFRIGNRNDKFEWWKIAFSAITTSSEKAPRICGICFSIEEVKQHEKELIIAKDMAAQAELKQSFLANISHEIRTPLNVIVGFTNLLTDNDDITDEERHEIIQTINKNCETLLKLINDILELSLLESGKIELQKEFCNPHVLLSRLIEQFESQKTENVKFKLSTPIHPVIFKTDEIRLKNILSNLIHNAVKFTHEGTITIGYKTNENKEIIFFVQDTGCGICEKKLLVIFDHFYKEDEFTQGSGLGLSISARITKLLNGVIKVDSQKDKGSCFSIIFPLTKEDKAENPKIFMDTYSPKPENVPKADRYNNFQKPCLLIAEDIESNFLLLQTIIGNKYNIIWAKNGKEAVDLFKSETVNMILMDIKMPEMNGIEALKEIRKISSDIPIVMQTAHAFDRDREIAEKAGCNGFITKPINPQILRDMINRFINIDSYKRTNN
ncbi:response regulator [Coprobacter tertius]|uniref:histidine kinase n=1 Tax=Coprobacter tertius TaxID=2944915 RepID=A0ABT1MDJ8_9BACT|nr:response regulator [Coprobacter tertius]